MADQPKRTDPAPSDAQVTARDLSLWYGDTQALRDITLDIRKGDHRRSSARRAAAIDVPCATLNG
jgi:hypothetical protein